MLNKLLYDALVYIFKDVDIIHEGEQAQITPTPDGSGKWNILHGDDRGEQYAVNCPYCHDTKKHLSISYLSYVCPIVKGTKLRIGTLRAHCFRRECQKDPANMENLKCRIGFGMSQCGDGQQEYCEINCDDQFDVPPAYALSDEISLEGFRSWVPDWYPVDTNTDPVIMQYLADRRVSLWDVSWLNIGWGPVRSPRSHRLLNDGLPAILFPIINNGKLVGVQARYPDAYRKEDTPKYWFHPGCKKQLLLYNLDVARNTGLAVVTEGVFDVLSVGKPGVCCFGHTPSKAQQRLLCTFAEGVIFLPDTDAHEDFDAVEIAKQQAAKLTSMRQFSKGVEVVKLPVKDAGEMTRGQVWNTIIEQVNPEMKEYILERNMWRLN